MSKLTMSNARYRTSPPWALASTLACGLIFLAPLAAAENEPRESKSAGEKRTPETGGGVPDEAARLFEEGRRLSAAGNFSAACATFERSANLSAGVGTKYNLADCFEHLGKNKSARDLFLEVAAITRELGQTKRERAALARASALDAKMARLTLDLSAADRELRVNLDGKELASDALRSPIDLDPGYHELTASAKGKKPWSLRVAVPSGPANVMIVVPALEAEQTKLAVVEPKAKPRSRKQAIMREGPTSAQSGPSTRRTVSLVLGGVGIAGTIGGGYMAVRYLQNHEDSKTICPTSRACTDAEIDAHTAFVDEAKTARIWSFVGFGVGGAALVGATYLFLTEPDASTSTKVDLRAMPFVGSDGSVGGALSGRF